MAKALPASTYSNLGGAAVYMSLQRVQGKGGQ